MTLVTGVTSGLGRGIATAFAKRGAQVVGTGRRDELRRGLESELADAPELTFVRGDVTAVADCEQMALCDDDARLVTGAVIAIDRAMSAGFLDSMTTYMTSAGLWSA